MSLSDSVAGLKTRLIEAGEQAAKNDEADIDKSTAPVPARRSQPLSSFAPPAPPVPVSENDWTSAPVPRPAQPVSQFALTPAACKLLWGQMANVRPGTDVPLPLAVCQPASLLTTLSHPMIYSDMLTDAAKAAVSGETRWMVTCSFLSRISKLFFKLMCPLVRCPTLA